MSEPVRVELGFDRFEAILIAEACRADGLTVELLLMDESGNAPGLQALTPHHLLVWEEELEQVRVVLDRQSGD